MMKKNNLSWLIAPFTSDDFLQNYLEKKPMIITRDDPDYFQELLTFDDIDFIVSHMNTMGSYDIRMSAADKVIFEKQYSNVSRLQNIEVKSKINTPKMFDLFNKHGATIIIEQLSNVWPSVFSLCQTINGDLKCSSGANVYISPAESQGFEAHYDTHDVFILQLYGSKKWRLYNSPIYLPLGTQPSVPYNCSDADPIFELDIKAGDVIYIPRGFVHEVMTTKEVSAHITLGVYGTTWTRLVLDGITKIANSSEVFRTGFLADDYKGDVDKDEILESIKQEIAKSLTLDMLNSLSQKYISKTENALSLKMNISDREIVERSI